MRVKDKVAIDTGGGSGLRKAIAMRLASEGASIVVADVNEDAMNATVQELTAAGHKAAGYKAAGYKVDVSNREQLKETMHAIVEKFERIDILVNNAGVTRHRPFLELNSCCPESENCLVDPVYPKFAFPLSVASASGKSDAGRASW